MLSVSERLAKYNQIVKWTSAVTISLLLFTDLNLLLPFLTEDSTPILPFRILNTLIFLTSLYYIYFAYLTRKPSLVWIFTTIALIYNPFSLFVINFYLWVVFDVIVAIVYLFSYGREFWKVHFNFSYFDNHDDVLVSVINAISLKTPIKTLKTNTELVSEPQQSFLHKFDFKKIEIKKASEIYKKSELDKNKRFLKDSDVLVIVGTNKYIVNMAACINYIRETPVYIQVVITPKYSSNKPELDIIKLKNQISDDLLSVKFGRGLKSLYFDLWDNKNIIATVQAGDIKSVDYVVQIDIYNKNEIPEDNILKDLGFI